MTGIYSGSQIKDLKGRHQKITRTQTAAQAYSAIIAKYGSISATERYYHIGKGVWKKYSLENDRKRTGKLADTKEEWESRPHKFDWPGVDTKAGSGKGPSRKFSVGMLKAPEKMKGRISKSPVSAPLNRVLPFKTFSGLYRDVAYTVNADTRMMSFKWDFSKHTGYHTMPPSALWKLKDIDLNPYAISKTDAYRNVKKCIDIIHWMWDNLSQRYADAADGKYNGDFVAKATRTGKYAEKKKSKKVFSVEMLKPGQIKGRKEKSALKFTGNHVLKRMPKMKAVSMGKPLDDLQAQRLDLLLNMEYVAPTNDPLNKYMKYETELIRTFPDKQSYKQWREKNLEFIKKKGLLQKFKNIKTVGAQGKRKVTVREMPAVKGYINPVKAEAHKAATLKEINIRLDELKKVYEPIYRENRQPTAEEAKLIKEANVLIRKRDGIVDRKTIAANKKEERVKAALRQSATAKAAEARRKEAEAANAFKKPKALTNKAVMDNASKDYSGRYTFIAERKDGKKEQGFEKTVAAFITSIGRRGYWRENPVIRLGVVQKDDSIAYLKSFPAYKEPEISSKPSEIYWMHGKKPDSMKTLAEKVKLSQLKPTSKPSRRTEKVAPRASKEPAVKKIAVAGKFRYASFMRPLGPWFNPGIPLKLEAIRSTDRDFRFNRAPHSVISTNSKLSEDTLKKFELTDLAEGRKMQELIVYVNKHDFLNDNMKRQLEDLILKGKSKEDVDKYIEKGKKIAEKKKVSSKPSLTLHPAEKSFVPNTVITQRQEILGMFKDLVRNVKVTSPNFTTIRVECGNVKDTYDACVMALEEDHRNDPYIKKLGGGVIKFKGVTIKVVLNRFLALKPFAGEFKGYRYKVDTANSKIQYFVDGGHVRGQDDTFNVAQETKEDLKQMAEYKIGRMAEGHSARFIAKPMQAPKKTQKSAGARKKGQDINVLNKQIEDLQAHIKAQEIEYPGYKDISEHTKLKRLITQRNKMLGVEVSPKNALSPEEVRRKQVIEEAHADWNNQCKMFMSGKIPFRDKDSKECVNRHLRSAGLL